MASMKTAPKDGTEIWLCASHVQYLTETDRDMAEIKTRGKWDGEKWVSLRTGSPIRPEYWRPITPSRESDNGR